MTPYTEHSIHCPDSAQGHQLHYRQWGDADNLRILFCVHGLTRNSHDFDSLAATLARDYRIICPDMAGRGDSDWLARPQDYNDTLYVNDMLLLLENLHITLLDWLGTSMGGLIGMMLAAREHSPIHRLIINDIGAFLPQAALQRIAAYLQQPAPMFSDLAQAETYLRDIHAPFGRLSDAQWQHLTRHSTRLHSDGCYRLHYDAQIRQAFTDNIDEVDLGTVWQRVRCPVLLLHGLESDLLLPDTIALMQQSHPHMQVVHIPDTGHAPALMEAGQIQIIQDFLGDDSCSV